jgi:hypothetical protein
MSNNYLKPLFSPSMYGSGVRIVNTSIFHLDETDVLTAHRYLSVKGKLSPLVWSPSLMPGGRPFKRSCAHTLNPRVNSNEGQKTSSRQSTPVR